MLDAGRARLEQSLDPSGELLDSASPALGGLRRAVRVAYERLRSRLETIVHSSDIGGALQEPLVTLRNGRYDLHWVDPFGGETEEQVGEDKIVAPLPGTVVALLAEEGAKLEQGAAILTLEVMKMEQTLRAPFAGVLKLIKCKVGDIVQEGVELAEVEPLGS